MIDPLVRVAVHGDLGQLDELEAEVRSSLVGQRGGDRWLEEHTPHSPTWTVVSSESVAVGHIDGVLVGYLVLTRGDRIATVESVWVTPGAREVGFGDALLEWALSVARADGCEIFEGQSLPGDRNTKNLYERAGIKARLITTSTLLAD